MRKYSVLLCQLAVCVAVTLGWSASSRAEDELVQLIVSLLSEADKDMRALAFEQMRDQAVGEEATKQFAAQLTKLRPDAQVGLLSALADRGDVAARPAVLELLETTADEPVKLAAIRALGSLGSVADLSLLVRLVGESSSAEKAARSSLVRLRGDTVSSAIAAEMKHAPRATRVALIEILTTRRALDTIDEIMATAIDDDPVVRAAAMISLGKIAGPEQIPAMVAGVLKAEKGRERVAAEKAVMRVCHRIDSADKRATPLLSVMDQLSQSEREILFSTLGRVGGPVALEVIESAINAGDPRSQDIGIRALCNWPDASVASRLLQLARTHKHPGYRKMTLRALIRVAPFPDERTDLRRLDTLRTAAVMCQGDSERNLVLDRVRAIRIVQSLRFLMPFVDQPPYAELACESVVELAHHRELRDANKDEFDRALDKVIQTSKNATVVDRANRYKDGQTWVRPANP